jgi:hypothetical protein
VHEFDRDWLFVFVVDVGGLILFVVVVEPVELDFNKLDNVDNPPDPDADATIAAGVIVGTATLAGDFVGIVGNTMGDSFIKIVLPGGVGDVLDGAKEFKQYGGGLELN